MYSEDAQDPYISYIPMVSFTIFIKEWGTQEFYTHLQIKCLQSPVKESKEQTVGRILTQGQEIWAFTFTLRQKSPLEIQFMSDRYIMVY